MSFRGAALAGYLVAALGFVLLFVVLAKFIPLFDRFAEGAQGKYLAPISFFFICAGGLLRHRARAKMSQGARRGG